MIFARTINHPLTHFILIGALIYGISFWWRDEVVEHDIEELSIPEYQISLANKEFAKLSGYPPEIEEQKRLFDKLVDQEILLRYALALGMHHQPVVQRRLAQIGAFIRLSTGPNATPAQIAEKVIQLNLHRRDLVAKKMLLDGARRLIRSVVLVRQVPENVVRDYLNENQRGFMKPKQTRITHIFSNQLKHGSETQAHALGMKATVESEGLDTTTATLRMGDAMHIEPELPALSNQDLIRQFGERFVKQLDKAPIGSWSGPYASRYGLHIVYVHERTAPVMRNFDEIKVEVERQLVQKLADEWLVYRLAQLRQTYQITIPKHLQ